MNERENILRRIREGLKQPAPLPGQHAGDDHSSHLNGVLPKPGEARQWLPPVGNSFEEQVQMFRTQAADLKAEFYLLDSLDALETALAELKNTNGWKRIAAHTGTLTDKACRALKLPTLRTDTSYSVRELEQSDVGITECDALIAQTGSVLITSRSAGGRALSVLPPHHLVLARRDQLLPDLTEAFDLVQRKYAPDYPSFISLVTGPSRTGDIERILVLGAHGPKKLTIICI